MAFDIDLSVVKVVCFIHFAILRILDISSMS